VTSGVLETAAGLGPSLVVVAVAAGSSGAGVRVGPALRRVTVGGYPVFFDVAPLSVTSRRDRLRWRPRMD